MPGAGWDLHECRQPGLTHLGEAGATLPMLMAKSRHKKPENVRKYFHPSAEAIAEVTSLALSTLDHSFQKNRGVSECRRKRG